MGGIDWSGFPMMVAKYGIDDPDDLIERLTVIRLHRPPQDDPEPQIRQ